MMQKLQLPGGNPVREGQDADKQELIMPDVTTTLASVERELSAVEASLPKTDPEEERLLRKTLAGSTIPEQKRLCRQKLQEIDEQQQVREDFNRFKERVLRAARNFAPFNLPEGWEQGYLNNPKVRNGFALVVFVTILMGGFILSLVCSLVSMPDSTVAAIIFGGIVSACISGSAAAILQRWKFKSRYLILDEPGNSYFVFRGVISPEDQKKILKIGRANLKSFDQIMVAGPKELFERIVVRTNDPVLCGKLIWNNGGYSNRGEKKIFRFKLYFWKG